MLAVVMALAPAALANTYHPNKFGDHAPGTCNHHDCTLREAVTRANNHPGGDTIVLRGGKHYNLARSNSGGLGEDLNATGDLDVAGRLKVASSNRKLARVDAHEVDRVFDLGPANSVSVSFKRLRIRNGRPDSTGGGNAGGGIRLQSDSSLALVRTVVSGNDTEGYPGGGIYASDGTRLKLVRSAFKGNDAHNDGGGGLEVYGRARISRSTIAGNRSRDGGAGIDAYQTEFIKVTQSTIAGNRSSGIGGVGGAVRFYGSDTSVGTFVNDTIANNHASIAAGGLFDGGSGEMRLNAVTVARNSTAMEGGGIYDDDAATLVVNNSLIGLNTSGTNNGPDCFADGSLVSGGHNLVANVDTGSCAPGFNEPGDITGVSPRIKQLANNGGPTKTIALRRHSKAINHAGGDAPKRDQRGVKRHNPDIGAFERR